MLDLTKLSGQLPGISQHLKQEAKASQQRLKRAMGLMEKVQRQQSVYLEQQQHWRDRILFTSATPIDPIETCVDLSPPPSSHTVFATDGSQIAPSHHQIAYCYLINVGRVMLHYGQSLHPLLDSLPEVFYKPEDLFVSRQWGIRTEEWMGHCRTVSEVVMLSEMACRWVNPPGAHFNPNLAMVDGSLSYWFLEGLPKEARDRLLPPILTAWEQMQQANIPYMGYLSASRNTEATNFFRFPACKYDQPDCLTHCRTEENSNTINRLPCQVIDPLRDATFWGHLLQPGQRSGFWQSGARVLDWYPEAMQIYFCYVHVGTEIARVDLPRWVVEDEALRERALSIMLAQVHKGFGYPVALAESHNQAVVRGSDRARFFALLEQQMVKAGLRNVGTSYKETRKRGSIA